MHAADFFSTPVEFLKGVGPQRAEILKKEAGVATFGDLLTYFPFRHVDRTVFHKIRDINASLTYVQLKGKLVSAVVVG
jgi:ATP-dependent DNA helicase RecG